MSSESTVLAHPPGDHCFASFKHSGEPRGKIERIGGVETYVATPPSDIYAKAKGVILYYADVFGPLYVNNMLIMDYFAEKGFVAVGLDYFERDSIQDHEGEENFDRAAWGARKKARAKELVPGWNVAVMEKFGKELKYSAVGYCFGAPYVLDIASTDQVVATAIVHPTSLSEEQFKAGQAPLLLSCAEIDRAFPPDARRRAEDILIEHKRTYHIQVFSGVTHGFAVRGNPEVENERWAKEESAGAIVRWFTRFSINA